MWILTSREGSGMSAGPWPPACPSAAGLKVMSACGWLFWPGCWGCWGCRGWRGGWEDGGPLWCNGWADRLLGWGDACMPGCMEAWDWSALTGWGICRGRREERWVYLYKMEHSDWESSSGSIDRQRARQMSCRWFQSTYTFVKLRWFAKQYIWQNMQNRSKL